MLLYMYRNQYICTRWNQIKSEEFLVNNGVKQGGVISPVLFCIYMDDLLKELHDSGVGCHIGPYFFGSLCYADDIILLNPTLYATRKMLQICEKYAVKHYIQFNSIKSQTIAFPTNKTSYDKIELNGITLSNVTKTKHLGHMLNNTCYGSIDVDYIKMSIYRSVNMLLSDFNNIASNILVNLFKSYCTSLYGIVLCDITAKGFTEIEVAWRKCLRRILRVNPRTHNIVYLISSSMPLKYIVLKRIMSFLYSIHESENMSCKYIAKCCKYQTMSNMGRNYSVLSTVTNVVNLFDGNESYSVNFYKKELYNHWFNQLNKDLVNTSVICRELIDVRDGILNNCLGNDSNKLLLDFLCTA